MNSDTAGTPANIDRPANVAIIGCGNIAGPYAQDLPGYDEINLLGVADIDPARAQSFAEKHGTRAYPSVDALLADPGVELAINLTTQHAHKTVTTQCLEAGKHVWSEKPLAMAYEDAAGLVELAQARGLRLGCSPFTLMGEAQQTAWKWLREGQLGTVRLIYAEVNWGRIEAWHPEPHSFYKAGPLFDVGVYPLAIITAIYGPARRVTAYGRVLHPDRTTLGGEPFLVEEFDYIVASIELEGGQVVRLTSDFYVSNMSTRQTGIEFHGDAGSLHLAGWHIFNSRLLFAPFDKPLEEVPLLRPPHKGVPWGRGVWEMVCAMREDRPHRFSGEHAAHVTEILCATAESAKMGRPVDIVSGFAPPAPMDWAT
ncbi:MAG TPA: Gfo/Idh/MocA family oxidoreductase [Chloroflexia bacterium]|nr:Gfo/Idh/MocA family oxidoreductase [Chloroflexia bacterium]